MSNALKVDPGAPVKLLPAYIPKPWGQEIWYTGMEERGESQVQLGEIAANLSTYLAAHPNPTNGTELLLLKILDPKPEPVLGDLYFEVHEHKQEVYVVTHVDPAAWPSGAGQIRFGMNQELRLKMAHQGGSDDAFRHAYRASVGTYEKIRRSLDETAAQEHTTELLAAEEVARAAMNEFTAVRNIAVGDVISVPTWTPHALQHGVRVVEFQTQTYERYIVSFAQKVLTQDHWDTDHALKHMHLDAPLQEVFETISPGIERIARFEDFNVWRCDGRVASDFVLPTHVPYAVLFALGDTQVGDLQLVAEEACFIPNSAITRVQIRAKQQVLLAAPAL